MIQLGQKRTSNEMPLLEAHCPRLAPISMGSSGGSARVYIVRPRFAPTLARRDQPAEPKLR